MLLAALAKRPAQKRPRLTLVGDGHLLERYRQMANDLGLSACVRFTGRLPAGEGVRKELDAADVFVMPSLTEGLPRAMVEAMARGLPCVGSTVGGIPELLPAEDLVPPSDAAALAAKLVDVLDDPARLTRMSARNLETSRQYAASIQEERRRAFYRELRDRTQTWLQRTC